MAEEAIIFKRRMNGVMMNSTTKISIMSLMMTIMTTMKMKRLLVETFGPTLREVLILIHHRRVLTPGQDGEGSPQHEGGCLRRQPNHNQIPSQEVDLGAKAENEARAAGLSMHMGAPRRLVGDRELCKRRRSARERLLLPRL